MFNQSKSSTISFNEIVFEHRNKSYGAFQLRKEQDNNLFTGFFITAASFAITVGCIYISFFRQAPTALAEKYLDVNERVLEIINLDVPETPKAADPKKNIAPPAGRNELNKDDLPPTPDPNVSKNEKEEKKNENPDTLAYNANGTGDKGLVTPSEGNSKGSETGKGSGENKGPEIRDFVEIMPEFPGGIENMYSFLGKNLRYPTRLRTDRISGTVFVSFVVNSQGKIGNVEILQTPDAGFNEEVIRVISKMPVWKPGYQSGQAVPVRFRMPVKFTIR
ncbi:MAG: energy transducer TonB [Bacteroidia bacterium]